MKLKFNHVKPGRQIWILPLALLLCMAAPAAASAALSPSPETFDFGDVDRYQTGSVPNGDISFKNTGVDPVQVGGVALQGPGFWINSDGCTGAVLLPSDSCSVSVAVSPHEYGEIGTDLRVSTVGDGDVDVPLAASVLAGNLQVNPSPVEFAPQPWYWGDQFQNVNLSAGFWALDIGSVSIEGPDAGLFWFDYNNCNSQILFAFGSCGVGIRFFSPVPKASTDASLEITTTAANGPVVSVPLNATALAGPIPKMDPENHDFGDIEVGEASPWKTFAIKNDGDFPLQVQQILIVSGASSMFERGSDQCTFQNVMPGAACTFQLRFAPTRDGDKDGSIFVIGDTPNGVETIGLSGRAVATSKVTALLSGDPRVGKELTCSASNATGVLSYSWLRGGKLIPGADSRRYRVPRADLGERIACRITASNAVSSKTSTSAETVPIEARDLAFQSNGKLSANQCRVVHLPELTGVRVRGSDPTTALSPLVLRSKSKLDVEIGGVVKSGKKVSFTPRDLRSLPDGSAAMRIDETNVGDAVLAPCHLVAEMYGSKRSGATVNVSSREAMGTVTVRVPKLRFKPLEGFSGELDIASGPDGESTVLPITGKKWKRDGVKFKLGRRNIVISGLPEEAGSVGVTLEPRVVRGRVKTPQVKVAAILREGGTLGATGRALWQR